MAAAGVGLWGWMNHYSKLSVAVHVLSRFCVLIWTERTLLHLSKHLSQNCLSALFPNSPGGHSCVGRGGSFAGVQGGPGSRYKLLSLFVAGIFGFFYGFRL